MFLHLTLHPWPNPVPGEVKFFDPPGQHTVFATLAEKSGITLFEPAGRFVAGILELVAAILILLPFSRRFGAVIAVIIFGAGLALHLSPWLGRELVLANGSADGGTHFLAVVILLALSLLLLVVHPGRPRTSRVLTPAQYWRQA
ncbi:hypothetical protein HNE_0727 [Hyphomonas neptunium ATCC 15444]|uniref:DoxX family protein n=3 Tax=Hyphomonas TaxID=85 RepID=Q0C488_HYPNA|nr:hypothetical protein HNE_0727 [Hyphomonas neptunium ATCC 15444]